MLENELSLAEGWNRATGRDVAALLDPRPTLIVGATGIRKAIGFATILWATPISHDPAMVAFALRESSHTMECIQLTGYFSLNVLPATERAAELAEAVGTRTGRTMNKDGMVPHHAVQVEFDKETTERVCVRKKGLFRKALYEDQVTTQHVVGKVPVVDIATSWMTCSVDRIEQAGDHLLVVGTVIEAQTTAPRDGKGHLQPTDALLCIQHGNYGAVDPFDPAAGETPKMPMVPPPTPPRR